MKISSITHTIKLGIKSLLLRKLRSALTITGIIFGVCSVITMLAVGEGAAFEAQERIKNLGSNNIIIESIKPQKKTNTTQENMLVYGLKRKDVEILKKAIPKIQNITSKRLLDDKISSTIASETAQITGTQADLANIENITLHSGRFISDLDYNQNHTVCVISKNLADKLFAYSDPINASVKIKKIHFTVIGVTTDKGNTDYKDTNHTVHIPLTTMVSRYGDQIFNLTAGSMKLESIELHKIIIQMNTPDDVLISEPQITHILNHHHNKKDFKVIVPLQLLRQAKETQKMFSIVLGSIAAISLIVGGIGIMNIMLATVSERTREIGIRRALGAKKRDIISQFMTEAVLLSLTGGIIGIILGIAMPHIISNFTSIKAIVSPASVILAFIVSALTGIIFGIYPAAKSAQLDPVEALRNE